LVRVTFRKDAKKHREGKKESHGKEEKIRSGGTWHRSTRGAKVAKLETRSSEKMDKTDQPRNIPAEKGRKPNTGKQVLNPLHINEKNGRTTKKRRGRRREVEGRVKGINRGLESPPTGREGTLVQTC